jgi:hypothetical protein
MLQYRQRTIVIAGVTLAVVWLLVFLGYALARNARVTADRVRHYLQTVDLRQLNPADRAKALRNLAAQLNALSPEERRKARLDREWPRWFDQMTEEERTAFLDATVPTGFKQMINAFEDLSADKRQKTIDDALKRLQEARLALNQAANAGSSPGPNEPPPIDEELRQKIITLGLKTYYSQSSAKTKAELAPVLEELQRSMETGRLFMPRHGLH